MNIVIIAGSNRKSATSTHLAEYIAKLIRQRNHQVTWIDLYHSPLPFYSSDQSYAEIAAVTDFKHAILQADAVVLASPEYHGSISGVLKNALDFVSKDHFSGKAVLSISSAGGAVGISSLQQLQAIVRNLHGINAPEWISIGGSQRKSFEASLDVYEVSQDIDDRIHRALGAFLELARLVRG
ncbi:NADPH-dependent oxidoreductase [Paenibacillus selenitireducens]|uniref:NADPH-dependent oxidoreductase n=1 Tax=Paenibacillus selenitireducens TaxID=1324314 RepID=A0A1T2XD55_9BACL|nr:NADPH-dependent FMN reductase [Paenibacillus selenitireducens]OPA77758.1 NADPH-dependent oxidoreductase [Paenibacillus selenitireducens]